MGGKYHNAARRAGRVRSATALFTAQRAELARRLAPVPFTFTAARRMDPVATGWLLVTLARATGIPLNAYATRQAVAAMRATGGAPPCANCCALATVPVQRMWIPWGWFACSACGLEFYWDDDPDEPESYAVLDGSGGTHRSDRR